jgi:hypothetical protein
VSTVSSETYSQYFTSSKTLCVAEKYEIVHLVGDDQYEAMSDGEVKMGDEGHLSVKLQGEPFNNECFLQATSVGGVVARAQLQVTIKPSNNDCTFTASPDSLDIALDYEEGK